MNRIGPPADVVVVHGIYIKIGQKQTAGEAVYLHSERVKEICDICALLVLVEP